MEEPNFFKLPNISTYHLATLISYSFIIYFLLAKGLKTIHLILLILIINLDLADITPELISRNYNNF